MKFINLLTLLFAAFFFAGCASTDDSASATDNTASDAVGSQDDAAEGLLMDRYKSGEIPGLHD